MKPKLRAWYGIFRSEGLDPVRAFLLALLKVKAEGKR